MSPALPPHPNLDHLKKQAKELLKSYRAGRLQVCNSLRQYLPRFSRKSASEILAAGISLHDAQYVVAREYGFDNWSALRNAVLESAVPEMEESKMGNIPALDRLDERLQRHIEILGFGTVGSYRIWCHKQGLDSGLNKSDAELRQELEEHRQQPSSPEPRPDYRPSEARFITRAYQGEEDIWGDWKQPFEGVEDEGERAALHRLLLHCAKYARTGGPLVWQLARYYRDWLRPVEEWIPRSQSEKEQLAELTRFLLGCEEMPLSEDSRVQQDTGPSVRHQQGRIVLTPAEIASFEERGYVHVPEAFPRAEALKMQDFMWSELERRHGFQRDDPSTWELPRWKPSQWTRLGLNRTKDHSVYDAIASPRLMGTLEQFIGPERAALKKSWGAFVVTFPEVDKRAWDIRSTGWHVWAGIRSDFAPMPSSLRVVTFYSHVGPQGGGPLIVEGSHRLVMSFCNELKPSDFSRKLTALNNRFAGSHPWLAELAGKTEDQSDRIRRFMEKRTSIDGVEVKVVELKGEPGDAVLCHPAIFSSSSYNCADVPSFIRG